MLKNNNTPPQSGWRDTSEEAGLKKSSKVIFSWTEQSKPQEAIIIYLWIN